jgi:hypothetical protein
MKIKIIKIITKIIIIAKKCHVLIFQTHGVDLLFKILQRVIDNEEADENAADVKSMTFGALSGVLLAKEKFEKVQ